MSHPDPKQNPKAFLSALFDAAVAAAQPAEAVPQHLPEPPNGRTIVVGAGKAAAAMARAVEDLALIRSAATTEPLAEIAPPALGDLTIGLCRTPYWEQACPATQGFVEDAAWTLAQAGADIAAAADQ